MLSGNEHSHNECLTADDADGKAGRLAGGGMKTVRVNEKTPIMDEISSNGAKLCVFLQDTVLQHIGREEGITDPISFAGRVRNFAQNSISAIHVAIFIIGILG